MVKRFPESTYAHVDTHEPMPIRNQNRFIAENAKTHNDFKFGKEIKTIIVVDKSLFNLTFSSFAYLDKKYDQCHCEMGRNSQLYSSLYIHS